MNKRLETQKYIATFYDDRVHIFLKPTANKTFLLWDICSTLFFCLFFGLICFCFANDGLGQGITFAVLFVCFFSGKIIIDLEFRKSNLDFCFTINSEGVTSKVDRHTGFVPWENMGQYGFIKWNAQNDRAEQHSWPFNCLYFVSEPQFLHSIPFGIRKVGYKPKNDGKFVFLELVDQDLNEEFVSSILEIVYLYCDREKEKSYLSVTKPSDEE